MPRHGMIRTDIQRVFVSKLESFSEFPGTGSLRPGTQARSPGPPAQRLLLSVGDSVGSEWHLKTRTYSG